MVNPAGPTASDETLRLAGSRDADPPIDALVAWIEQRSHELWTTEPAVPLDRRRELLDDLSAVDGEIAAVSLALIDGHRDPGADAALRRRVTRAAAQLHALEIAWQRSAA